MTGDISSQKSAARKAAFARRKLAHQTEVGEVACANLLAFLAPHTGKETAAYMAIRTEIDPLPVMKEIARTGPVGVPVILGAGQPLEFHRWRDGEQMQDGPFGARVPVTAELLIPSVVILPLVAFDRQGFRLGYGGGFYDRTLEILRARGSVLAVGFAYSAQEFEHLPTEPTDQPLDAIVTELGVRLFSQK